MKTKLKVNYRSYLFNVLTAVSLMGFQVSAAYAAEDREGGSRDGGGGNFFSAEEVQKANRHIKEVIEGDLDADKAKKNKDIKALLHQVADALIAKSIKKIRNVEIGDFKKKVDQALILFTDQELKLNNKPKQAINYPEQGTVLVNKKSYDASSINVVRHLLTHEVLGLMKEDDEDYLLSGEFMEYSGSPASLVLDKTYQAKSSNFLNFLKRGYAIPDGQFEKIVGAIKKAVVSCQKEIPETSIDGYKKALAQIAKAEREERFYVEEANKARIGSEIIVQINREFCVGVAKVNLVLEQETIKNIWGRYNPYPIYRVMAQNKSNLHILVDELSYYNPPAPSSTTKRKDFEYLSLYHGEMRNYFDAIINELHLFFLSAFMIDFVEELLK